MSTRKVKKEKPQRRFMQSDSESDSNDDDRISGKSEFDVDVVEKLSVSMKRMQLTKAHHEDLTDSDESDHGITSRSKKRGVNRKPPRGRKLQQLEDFSWSSSEDESDIRPSASSQSKKIQINPPKTILSSTLRKNSNISYSSSVVSSPSITLPSSKKKPELNNPGPINSKPICFATNNSYFSDSSLSLSSSDSSSDDDCPIVLSQTRNKTSPNKKTDSKRKSNPKRKGLSWSFNKSRKEYTIGGNDKIPPFSMSSELYDKLYDFQKEGVSWMAGLYLPKIGGILGDDMGMGKTFTTLSLLGGLMKAKTIRKAVVVAPLSVLRNWENEARKIFRLCCKVKIQVLSSDISAIKRKIILHEALEAQSPQLVITTYGLVANNPDHFTQRVVGRQVWDYVILDEAQKIKNQNTNNNKGAELIAQSANTRRLILTGTPIMNNLQELYALFTFATSGKVLGSHRDFQDEFGKPIEAARSADAEEHEVKVGEEAMKELQKIIQPYFLQRTKAEYLSEALPPKREYVLWTNLSPLQRKLYNEYIQSESVCSIVEGEAESPLFAITWLQKLCGHPLLVKEKSVDMIADFDEHDPKELLSTCTKLEVMYNIVCALIKKGHRTLIFSQFTKVLDIICRVLESEFKMSRIDGQTEEQDRQKTVDEFNEPNSDIQIMLISTKAGGQGLTLTGADSCVVYDPSWNPADDAQAVDRCYRLGQQKEVQVYRLIAAGTVEEKRYEKQIHKDGIRRAILTNTGNKTAKYFTKEELRKKLFILGDKCECEFLEKLEIRGFAFDKFKNPEHSYESHKGVVGQSSHDIVYSLPEDFYLDDMIPTPSHQPFSSPPIQTQWLKQRSKPMIVGRSQIILEKETDYCEEKENKGKNGSTNTGKVKLEEGHKKYETPCTTTTKISSSFSSPPLSEQNRRSSRELTNKDLLAQARVRKAIYGDQMSSDQDDEIYDDDYEEEF